jgi:mono/diheme cytochrome c family protein
MTEASQPTANPPTPAEPSAARRAVPVWLFVLLFILLFWGMVFFDQRSGWANSQVYTPYHSVEQLALYQPGQGDDPLVRGKAKYEEVCALCHNTDGSGKPNQAPPLSGSDWATGSVNRMIRIPLIGLSGPIKVKDQEMNLSMPAMGAAMTDEQLAAVLSYIRASFGNKASLVTPDQVKAVRTEVGNRSNPFTAAELSTIP